MTTFFRLVDISNKEESLKSLVDEVNSGKSSPTIFNADPCDFSHVPGSPFSYWTSNAIRFAFNQYPALESDDRTAKQGLASGDDFRFVRLSWEVSDEKWVDFAKGGQYSPHYADIYLKVNWKNDGEEIACFSGSVIRNKSFYKRPALTWPRRTTSGLSIRPMPSGCIFADKGPAIFVANDEQEQLLALQAIISSGAFAYLLGIQLAAADSAARSYEVGLMQQTPIPVLNGDDIMFLSSKAKRVWELKYTFDSINESSHAFCLPQVLQDRLGSFEVESLVDEYNSLVLDIDEYCFGLYNFRQKDRIEARKHQENITLCVSDVTHNTEKEVNALLSWVVGVAFGRFNTREYLRESPLAIPESPFAEISSEQKNIGEKKEFFFSDGDIQGSLVEATESVLSSIGIENNVDIESWLSKDFFPYHISEYTQSRRAAPIYWKLESLAGTSSVWLYIDSFSGQTLYKVVNDYVLPKLKNVGDKIEIILSSSNRTPKEEKELTVLTDSREDIQDFREQLLKIANFWVPNLNDGVQIVAAPLWRLFKHKPWQKKLKQTWEQLEDGDYDWAHLAYTTWPERVLKKCHVDRSLAIAHDVETDLWHEVEVIKGRKKEPVWEWQPKPITPAELNNYIREKIATDERLTLYRSNANNSGVKS